MILRDFIAFLAFYFITKALILFIHLETRRNNVKVPAAVSGILS